MEKTQSKTNWFILPYLVIEGVPCVVSKKHGPTVESKVLGKLELMAARYIVGNRIQIRGYEFKFLRKIAGFTRAEIAKKFDVSEQCIVNWEKDKDKAPSIPTQVMYRIIIADKLGVQFGSQIQIMDEKQVPNIPVHLFPSDDEFKKSA
jgi:DNA-binding XRE family transcriptional regulator